MPTPTLPSAQDLLPALLPGTHLKPYGFYHNPAAPPPALYSLLGDATAYGSMVTSGLSVPYLTFNATDYVTTPTVSTTNWGSANLSFGLWVNMDDWSSHQQTLFQISQTGRVIQCFVRPDTGRIQIYFRASNHGVPYFTGEFETTPLVNGQDHFLWFAHKAGAGWEIWIDGVNQSIATRTDSASYNMSNPAYWGRTSGGQQLNGKIYQGLVLDGYIGNGFSSSLIAAANTAGPTTKLSDTLIGVTVQDEWWVA